MGVLAFSEPSGGPLALVLERKLVFVSGKGGTGKSTVAAALASLAARGGKEVLLVFTDGRADASPLFGAEPAGYAETELAPHLRALTTSFDEVLTDFVHDSVPIGFIAAQVLASSTFRFFTRAVPGLPDLLFLGKLRQILQRKPSRTRPRYDLVVVDAPATGHALSLLALPRTVLKTIPAGPLRKLAVDLNAVFTDPVRSTLVLVAEPAELSARETEEMVRGADGKAGLKTGLLVLNRIGRGGKAEGLPRLPVPSIRVPEIPLPPGPLFLDRFVALLSTQPEDSLAPLTAERRTRPRPKGAPRPDSLFLAEMLRTEHLVVLLGPGGVGKTTLAAACGLAAARLGRKALVMTVDPAHRLVQALGLEGAADRPVEVRRPGIGAGGRLTAMQIDPGATFDRLLGRIASPEAARRIRANRLYAGLVDSLPGVIEYMGVEALAEHAGAGATDLIVLDTPPAARGLDFLTAPKRMVDLLDHDALRWFLRSDSLLNRALSGSARGAAAVLRLADRALGFGFLSDVADFFRVFDGLYDGFAERSRATAAELEGASYLVVTSTDATPLQTAASLVRSLADRKVTPGLLVNRVPREEVPDFPDPLRDLPRASFAESASPSDDLVDGLAARILRGAVSPVRRAAP